MTDAVLILLCVFFLLLIGFSIPCIVQIWRTVKELAFTLRIFNQNLPVIMKNLEEITSRVNQTTAAVQGQIEDLSILMKKVKGMLILLVGLEEIIRRGLHAPFVPVLRNCLAISKGVRVFFNHLLSGRRKGE